VDTAAPADGGPGFVPHAGIGSALVPQAPGVYHGLDVAIVTVDFGNR